MASMEIEFLNVDGQRIAYRRRSGRPPWLLFLPGYASDMEGSKALALDAFAAEAGLSMVRFDYSGTGSSGGSFEEGTLDRWLAETLACIDELTDGPLVLVGSSMGGWIALHAALRRSERICALVGIAAAPDFTEWGYSDEQKDEIRHNDRLEEPNPYAVEPQVTNRPFWQSGQGLLLLEREIPLDCPVRLIHGDKDEDVPLEIAFRTMRQLRSGDVQLLVIKGSGHRLSAPHEIEAIRRTVSSLLEQNQ